MAGAVIFAGQCIGAFSTKPAGAYVIANVFRSIGISAVVIDHVFRLGASDRTALIDKFIGDDTIFIGLSTTLLGQPGINPSQLEECDDLFAPILSEIKAKAPHVISVIGGSKIIQGERTVLPFDYGVIGQGENTLIAIINHVIYGDTLEISEVSGGVKYVSDRIYGYDGFNQSQNLIYQEEDAVIENETLITEFGRGCVFKCAFCEYDLTGKKFGDFTRTPEVIRAGLMHNYERWGTTRYIMTDDTINDSLEKAKLLESVVSSLPFNFEFVGYMRLELFQKHPETIQIYKDCGLRGVNFGIETFNKIAGGAVGKGFGEKAKPLLETLKSEWGDQVQISGNFIIGLPYDTLEDLERQQLWLEKTTALDVVLYNPLIILKKGRGLMDRYRDYYQEAPLSAEQLELCRQNAQKRQFYARVVNWQSPVMNYFKAVELNLQYFDRIRRSPRDNAFNYFGCFSLAAMMRTYTFEQLKAIKPAQIGPTMSDIIRIKLAEWLQKIHAVKNPVCSLPATRLTPTIVPKTHVFESKIKFIK